MICSEKTMREKSFFMCCGKHKILIIINMKDQVKIKMKQFLRISTFQLVFTIAENNSESMLLEYC
jgi:hypothetical protein